MHTADMVERLGRKYSPDNRDHSYLMSSVLEEPPPDRTWRYWWASGWWGDQGNTPQCVAYAWLHWVEDGPITHPYNHVVPSLVPEEMYDRAQRVDEWPGEDYDGTSVRAGAKILQAEKLVDAYRWAWDLDTVAQALLTEGPVIVGSWWWTDMFWPNQEGFIKIGGRREGGHAYVLNGINLNRGIARIKNSWGRGWGRNGHALISLDDLSRLLEDQGEACLAQELTRKGD